MKKLLFASLLLCIQFSVNAQTATVRLLTDNKTNPLGVDGIPKFSWQLQNNARNVVQTAYEIRVFDEANKLMWNSGKQQSDQSVFIPYGGTELKPSTKYSWQVRVWDNKGKAGPWSEKARWQMGLRPDNWTAKWIEPGFEEEALRPSPVFRKQFKVNKKIRSASAFITAHGMYEAFINGGRVGNDYLTPGWTSYKNRLQYQVYDVTDMLKAGENAIGVMLGSGWYRGLIGFSNQRNVYGKDIALLMQVLIQYADGSQEWIETDDTWKSSVMHVRYSEIYNGETIDARLEHKDWNLPGFNDSKWSGVKVAGHPKNVLVATFNEPVRKKETFKPVRVLTTPEGDKVIDFGQNLVGWIKVRVTGNAGDTINISHAEVLDKQGNFYITNLRAAKAEDNYILKGDGEEVFEPHFTWHGFRYARVRGLKSDIDPKNFEAVALYSDMKQTGRFNTSNALINQLQHNIEWGQKGNFLDVPTDCPQRDERLGWTGDAQVFARTATFNMNVHSFFSKWMKDVYADQVKGAVPFVVPNVLGEGAMASAGWADAATIIPWNIYIAYGDKEILIDQYQSMKDWVGYMQTNSTDNLWNKGFHFGDWLFYRPDDDNSGIAAVTDKYLIAQCFYAHSIQMLINAATVLGKEDDINTYTNLLQQVKAAFNKEYVTGSGRLVSGTQTAYVLALHFDMLPESQRTQAASRLVDNIKAYGTHLTTGFLGTPYLCHVLSRFGHNDIAYQLLLQESYPSWLYPVKMGATTIWERWDGMKPDSTFQTPGMNSFNHYAYGAIGDWMYRSMVGLDTDSTGPGYKHIIIKPTPGGAFTHANVEYETYYGLIKCGWKKADGKLLVNASVPANTRARIFIPATESSAIFENGKSVVGNGDITKKGYKDGYVELNVGSGEYNFSVDHK